MTATRSDPAGRLVAGSMRWWASRPSAPGHRRRSRLLVATPPSRRSTTARSTSGHLGSATLMAQVRPSGGMPATRTSPRGRHTPPGLRERGACSHTRSAARPFPMPPRSIRTPSARVTVRDVASSPTRGRGPRVPATPGHCSGRPGFGAASRSSKERSYPAASSAPRSVASKRPAVSSFAWTAMAMTENVSSLTTTGAPPARFRPLSSLSGRNRDHVCSRCSRWVSASPSTASASSWSATTTVTRHSEPRARRPRVVTTTVVSSPWSEPLAARWRRGAGAGAGVAGATVDEPDVGADVVPPAPTEGLVGPAEAGAALRLVPLPPDDAGSAVT